MAGPWAATAREAAPYTAISRRTSSRDMADTPPSAPVEPHGHLWLSVAGQSLGGRGRFALLGLIDACGSISQAARRMGMTYKNAWDAVDAMNTAAGEPLVERTVGGRGGGGARLTDRGRQLIRHFEQLEREHRFFLQSLQAQPGLGDDLTLIRRIGMVTSARNQFHGHVRGIVPGAVNDEIQLEVASGLQVVATITHDSVRSLGLEVGAPAFALVKASSVIVANDVEGARYSARNCFTGSVSRISRGAVNDEVVVDLGNGCSMVAIITRESTQALGLEQGVRATVLFKASSVIVGVPH